MPTVTDLLAKARGDIEILVMLDGYWDPALPDDPRVIQFHRGRAAGMRPNINAACRVASGDYFMKIDAHCLVSEGFDEVLKSEYQEDNWILTMRRYALDPEGWKIETGDKKYPIDYHYLSYPFERPDDPTCAIHGTEWRARRDARKNILLDDEMSSQGSFWFMSRAHWARLGEMEIHRYGNFVQEFQELGLKTWLGGGEVKVTKRAHYAHLYKGKRFGRGYSLGPTGHKEGVEFCTRYWMLDEWPNRVHDLRWLIEKFSPVPSWPTDLDEAFAHARRVLGKAA